MQFEVKWTGVDGKTHEEVVELEDREALEAFESELVDRGAVATCVTPIDGVMDDATWGYSQNELVSD